MSNKPDNRYMEFRLSDQLYAVPLLSVKEVIQKPEVTMIPNMPAHFEGMINLRGQILGVFNIKKKLATKSKETQEKINDVVIVIENAGIVVGMTVDEVTRVLHVQPDKISAAPLKENDPAHKYIESIIQTDQELVQTLNTDHLLELGKYKETFKAS